MANTVGPLIKEARTKAKLSQEALAAKIDGLSAADIGKAERGEKELSQTVLRQIAKATGVTQSSLVNAAKESTYGAAKTTAAAKKTAAAQKSASAKQTASQKTAAAEKKTAAAKKTTSTAKSSSAGAFELSAAEKKLVELYRAADADTKKAAVSVLKGEKTASDDLLSSLLGSAMDILGKK